MLLVKRTNTAMTALTSPGNNCQGFISILVILCLLMAVHTIRLTEMSKHDTSSLTIKQLRFLCCPVSWRRFDAGY